MNMTPGETCVENVTYDELTVGRSARMLRTLTVADIQAFAAVSGDTNPAHLDAEYANDTLFHGVIAHGMWGAALISAVLGTQFPGAGTIYLEQALHFTKPVRVGDTLEVTVTVASKDDAKKAVELDCVLVNQKGERVLWGTARVLAPTQKLCLPRIAAPSIHLFDPEARFKALLAQGQGLEPVRCAVVHPCDVASLRGALDAAHYGLIEPVLIGPELRIRHVAHEGALNLEGVEIISVAHSHAAAERAADLALAKEVEMIMKGSLHTDELLRAVIKRPGLHTARRMSHVFRFDVPMYSKPLLITDAALNINPNLQEKVDIVQNAIEFAHVLGVQSPKVAILSAVEMVNANIPSTLDAAALCKMADRGQITGGTLDGPLALDNAISLAAARVKEIRSAVAGRANVLVVPDLEAGNMLAKSLSFLAGADAAGIVLGARVPVVLTSRADPVASRLASCAIAVLLDRARREAPARAVT